MEHLRADPELILHEMSKVMAEIDAFIAAARRRL
jgi:hypothetical protein